MQQSINQSQSFTYTNKSNNIIDFFSYYNKKKSTTPPVKSPRATIPAQPLLGEDIQRVKDYLLSRPQRYKTSDYNLRNYTMFVLNINIGLRFGDLSRLKISDILDPYTGEIADAIYIIEQKTENTRKSNKAREISIRPELKDLLSQYLDSIGEWKPEWYLFHKFHPISPNIPIKVENVNALFNEIEHELQIKVPLATHSMRKTFARATHDRYEKQGEGLGIQAVREVLGHSSEAISRKYLGLTREHTQDIYLGGDMI